MPNFDPNFIMQAARGQGPPGQQFRGTQQPRQRMTSVPPPGYQPSQFMQGVFTTTENLEPEQRGAYVQSMMARLQDRLDRYNYRLSRGRELSSDQQTEYDSLMQSLNDLGQFSQDSGHVAGWFQGQRGRPIQRGTAARGREQAPERWSPQIMGPVG